MALARPLAGIVPPLLTPLLDRDTLDAAGLERLVEHVLAGGVDGLFLLGTTGEGPSLGHRLRREVVSRACAQARGRAVLLVGVTDTAFVESLALARHAADAGADALVLAAPYSMPEGQVELRESLGRLLPELPLPLFLYNVPPLTRVRIEIETVRWALDQEGVVGLKDSSGEMAFFSRVVALARGRPDWCVLMGPEELLGPSVLAGGHGGVPGGANLFPRLYCALYRAAHEGDLERTRELQGCVTRVVERLYGIGRHPSAVIVALKCAAALLGLASDAVAEPFGRLRETERRQVAEALEELEPLDR